MAVAVVVVSGRDAAGQRRRELELELGRQWRRGAARAGNGMERHGDGVSGVWLGCGVPPPPFDAPGGAGHGSLYSLYAGEPRGARRFALWAQRGSTGLPVSVRGKRKKKNVFSLPL